MNDVQEKKCMSMCKGEDRVRTDKDIACIKENSPIEKKLFMLHQDIGKGAVMADLSPRGLRYKTET